MKKWEKVHFDDPLTKEIDNWIKTQPQPDSLSELLKDGIEIHAHSSPSIADRKYSDIEFAKEAYHCEMWGIVLKAHEGDTSARAQLVQEIVPEVKTIGGVVLNRPVGGFNLEAVKMSHQLGGKIVWFPTVDADNHIRFKESYNLDLTDYEPGEYGGLCIMNKHGEITKEVKSILEYAAEHELLLASGHLSVPEIRILVPVLKNFGIKKFVVQHPDLHIINMSRNDQMWVANQGFFLEKCLFSFLPDYRVRSVTETIRDIKEVGHDHYVMVTDFGQNHHPTPIHGLNFFIQLLKKENFTDQQIKDMLSNTPKKLLQSSQ